MQQLFLWSRPDKFCDRRTDGQTDDRAVIPVRIVEIVVLILTVQVKDKQSFILTLDNDRPLRQHAPSKCFHLGHFTLDAR